MQRNTKIWLIAAASLVLLGCMIIGGAMAVLGWDFRKLSTVKFETNEYEIANKFKNIHILTDTADVTFIPSSGAETKVVCYEQKNIQHSVTVSSETLEIKAVDSRKWYEYIGFTFDSPKIIVYIPQGEYRTLSIKTGTGNVEIPSNYIFEFVDISGRTGNITISSSASENVTIKTSTGDIYAEHISTGTLSLSVSTGSITVNNATCTENVEINVSTGKAKVSNITCTSVISRGNTGNISLKNVIASKQFSISRSTGDVSLDACDAAEIYIKTDTGNVEGRFLSDKVFIAKTDTGLINVPKTITGGRCEITTNTGDICVTLDK